MLILGLQIWLVQLLGSGSLVRVVWFNINLIELTRNKVWYSVFENLIKVFENLIKVFENPVKVLILVRFLFNFVKILDKFGQFCTWLVRFGFLVCFGNRLPN